MRMDMNILLFTVCGLVFSGCVNWDVRMSRPKDTTSLTEIWCDSRLRDPESVRIRNVTEAVPGYRVGFLKVVDYYGWMWYASINGKNGFGGYTGFRRHVFILRDDSRVEAFDISRCFIPLLRPVKECKNDHRRSADED